MQLEGTFKILSALLLSGGTLFAQTAPDFTITDTDGVEWNLHEQLSLGKTVVLDFFFVDCVPCQSQSPEVSEMYQDYLAANADVLVLGISNRDSDAEVDQFDQTYGITYPTAGEDGGGDTVTTLYQSWFPFFGWPSYGVVCPDTTIEWGIFPSVPDVPELRTAVDACLGTASVREQTYPADHLGFDGNRLTVKSAEIRSIAVTDMLGRRILNFDNIERGMSFQLPTNAVFVLSLSLKDQRLIHLKFKL
jgi:peroxiredoxin